MELLLLDNLSARLDRLMAFRVKKILLFASLYEYFMLAEDGRLNEFLLHTYWQNHLGYVPQIRLSGDASDVDHLLESEGFDLLVVMLGGRDFDLLAFTREVKRRFPQMPIVVLAFPSPETHRLVEYNTGGQIDQIFTWQGNGSVMLGIIQFIEDKKNIATDTEAMDVPVILIYEDSVEFYSLYLPLIYEELAANVRKLTGDGMAFLQWQARQKSRPRVILASSIDAANLAMEKYHKHLLGVISDDAAGTGRAFVRRIRQEYPHIPVLIQSSEMAVGIKATNMGVPFIHKSSPLLLSFLRNFINDELGFSALQVIDENGKKLFVISQLNQLYSYMEQIPDYLLRSEEWWARLIRWLQVRAEFDLVSALRGMPRDSAQPLVKIRGQMKEMIAAGRRMSHRGAIASYSRSFYEDFAQFSRLGGGSVGGKARGLAFIDRILSRALKNEDFPGVDIFIPRTLVLGTDIFDQFMKGNDLLSFAVGEDSERHIAARFVKADIPPLFLGDLRDFTEKVKTPLAIRSSSLLEDSLFQPFAGIYSTKMLPNDQLDDDVRFANFLNAIKYVYSSTFFPQAKTFIHTTSHHIEEEKMAVVVQEVVGRRHGNYFYPDFSGVARSFNFYPVGHAKPEDGVAHVAVGLGKTVVDGGVSLTFCPAYPEVLPQYMTVKDMLSLSQREFYSVGMFRRASVAFENEDQYLEKIDIEKAEEHGVLDNLASTYSPENDTVYEGIMQQGPRVITFSHVLKHETFPLARLLRFLLKIAADAMGSPVEMEFAGNLSTSPMQFCILQVRPLVVSDPLVRVEIDDDLIRKSFCFSPRVLGNGVIGGIQDIVFVKPEAFQASATPAIASEIAGFNRRLVEENRSYLLIGPGRWGSSDPWLGIPVKWSQISGAKVIVEAAIPGMVVDPSQGSHFFQNVTSLRIGYFNIGHTQDQGFVDWPWLNQHSPVQETRFVRHIRLSLPCEARIDGRRGRGIIQPA